MLLRQVDPAEGLEIADHPVGNAVHHGDAPFARGELGFKTAETARVDGVADFANHLDGRALKENRVDVELLEVRVTTLSTSHSDLTSSGAKAMTAAAS